MYSILIVDDEPKIVNGLFEQFLDWKHVELQVYRAYSAVDALQILGTTKMDIVLTDIHMPGMSGLELQKRIDDLWPRCRVIFLTGYNDFEYIQSAMRNGGADYILKIEGDHSIISAVNKAIAHQQNEMVVEQFVHLAKKQLRTARPMLQKEYLLSLLQGELRSQQIAREQFEELQIPLSTDSGVLLVIGHVDDWKDGIRASDKPLLLFAMQNIAAEYLGSVKVIACSFESSNMTWLIQPAVEHQDVTDEDWTKCISFVHGTMPDIQETCKKLFKLSVSFALSSNYCDWNSVDLQHIRLQQILRRGLGQGREMILSDHAPDEYRGLTTTVHDVTIQEVGLQLRKIKQLESCLEMGQKEQFFELYMGITETARLMAPLPEYHSSLVGIQYALAALFLSHINQWGLLQSISTQIDVNKLLNTGNFFSWAEAETYFANLAEVIFIQKKHEQKDRASQFIAAVNQYIETHLAENLSLDILAEHVYLHPSYLSRLYKQTMGVGLSNYIKEMRLDKAKELLAQPRLKIHEVAIMVGFESPHYFATVFKKEMNLTPQEYKDKFGM